MKFAEKLTLVSWTFWLSLLAFQVVLTVVVHRLLYGSWDVALGAYTGLGVIAAILLMRRWARGRHAKNHPST